MVDIRGYISKYQYNLTLRYYRLLWTQVVKVLCFIKNVKIGEGTKFYGKTYFYRRPNSSIIIDSNCCFRSIFHSNLIGINRKCSVSTLLENAKIEIGNSCGFSGTVIGAAKSIKIGNNVRCGANTLITDNDWHLDDYRGNKPKAIIIEDNAWLGVNVVVLKGVIIGKNSIIGANSVVVKDIPPNVIAAGNPCKVIRKI
jgi:acetyltransferase-like isoleucine patch superfamily enzyme